MERTRYSILHVRIQWSDYVVRFHPFYRARRPLEWVESYSCTLSRTSAIDGPGHFCSRERPGTQFTGGWVGPRAGLDGGKSPPHRDSIPDRPARSQSLYRLSYRAHRSEYVPEAIISYVILTLFLQHWTVLSHRELFRSFSYIIIFKHRIFLSSVFVARLFQNSAILLVKKKK